MKVKNSLNISTNSPLLAFGALALCSMSGMSWAQKWDTTAAAKISVLQSDNHRLERDQFAEDSLETVYSALLGASRTGPRLDATVGLDFDHVQWSQIDFDNENNQTARVSLDYRARSYMTYGVAARYERDTYSSRFNVNEVNQGLNFPDNPDEGGLQNGITDAGTAQSQVRVKRAYIDPYVNWEISPRSSFRGTVNYRESKFSDTGVERTLFDYDDLEVGAEYKYSLSKARVDSLTLRLAHAQYSSGADGDTDRTRMPIKLIYQRPFTENLYLSASVGAVYIDSDSATEGSQTKPTYGAFVRWQGARFDMQFGANRYIQASSNASLRETSQILGSYLFNWTRRQKIGFAVQYYENETIEGVAGGNQNDQTYFTFSPMWVFEIGRSTQLNLSYEFRSLEEDNREDTESNALAATLTYRFWN